MLTSPIFMDVEASGIAERSYPIEIGYAFARIDADGQVELLAESHLITPTDAWSAVEAAWDSRAEPVHGLTRAILAADGAPVSRVVEALDAALAGAVVAADTGPAGWDADWITTLYAAAQRPWQGWVLAEKASGALVGDRFREVGLTPRYHRPPLLRWAPPTTHAAAEDALHFAWQWGMAQLLADSAAATLPPAEIEAAMADLPALVPRERWPRIAEAARFRRREAA